MKISFSSILLIFIVIFITSSSENNKMVGEAKKYCFDKWRCEGEDECRQKCIDVHKGNGICDLFTAFPVPKECLCRYDC
ncbi:unnamed protein product [Eruca vesicaria subsp. sativa]|uniref:Uncharacterized protein n=1 Tax=Eruca vesicaria subsp. sativa TaxID=29727 RepID=A0ABC8KUC8_ERUVS|nr:unnamed protein product [Eruca vesicaria subsp. sativa]